MRVLVLCDDYWHPARVPREGLAGLEGTGCSFDFIENASQWSAERMAEYPVMMLVKSDNVSAEDQTHWMSEGVYAALTDYVASGHGLLAVHSGTVGGQDKTPLRRLLGGVFDHHPEQSAVAVEPCAEHPVVEGAASFTQKDEHYFMNMDDQPGIEVFLTSASAHGQQPAGWARQEGRGKICVLTPGHNVEVWKEAAFQKMIQNALEWLTNE